MADVKIISMQAPVAGPVNAMTAAQAELAQADMARRRRRRRRR